MLTGLFRSRDSTEQAYDTLRTRGCSEEDVNVPLTDDTRQETRASSGTVSLGTPA
jgi:hypothetical protein